MTDSNTCFEFLLLTADEPLPLDHDHDYMEEKEIEWMDDSICQENLMDIIILSPEETTIDSSNHICSTNHFKLFFEELGYLSEEPELIDPTIDYEAEYNERLKQQKLLYKGKRRQHHIQLSNGSNTPSLLIDDTNTTILSSGVSSTSSSMHYDHSSDHLHHHHHHHHHHPNDFRSPLYLNHSSPSSSHHTTSHSNHHHHHHIPYNCNNVTLEKHHRLRHVH